MSMKLKIDHQKSSGSFFVNCSKISLTFFMICIEGENKKYESDEKKTGLVLISVKLNVEEEILIG